MTTDRLTHASEWFERLRDTSISTEEIAAWLAWCQEHPDNERAYRQVQEMWALAGDAGVSDWPDAAQVRADAYQGEQPVAEWNANLHPLPLTVEGRGESLFRRRWTRPALALAASLMLVAGLWFFQDAWLGVDSGVYSTERGGQRTVRLTDGSAVTLGGASTIRIDYGERRRDVALERGEAFFKVAHDRARPFVVHAPALRVTAVGTAFSVRADDVRTVVSVTEGIVDIAPGNAAPGRTEQTSVNRARAGEQVTYDSKRGAAELKPGDLAVAVGWQEGALTSVDEPLRSVIARVNRYSKREIVIDERVADLHFTGTVFENEIPEWAAGLERVFPIRTIVEEDGSVRLEPR